MEPVVAAFFFFFRMIPVWDFLGEPTVELRRNKWMKSLTPPPHPTFRWRRCWSLNTRSNQKYPLNMRPQSLEYCACQRFCIDAMRAKC